MGIYNEILVGRYARLLQKLFGIKGTVPTKQLAGEVVANFNLFGGCENRVLESWNRYGQTFHQLGVAAQNSVVQLRNPAGSNVLVVIEKLSVINETSADQMFFEQQGPDADLTGPTRGSKLDFRGNANSTAVMSGGNNIANQTAMYAVQLQQNVTYDFIQDENQELTLLPGDNLHMRSVAVNVAIRCSFIWRERFLEEGERAS